MEDRFLPQGSVDVSVWNTQWLLGRLIGVDQSRPSETSLPCIQEVSEDDDGEQPEAQVLSQILSPQGCYIYDLIEHRRMDS